MSSDARDSQFHRAVDIVQSLPKGGPVQTNYEEKLWLYSLYKQATEGDISISRPGLLDMLGRAKWDSWNKQKGVDKLEAKRLYVSALLKILRKIPGADHARDHIEELESYTAGSTIYIPRPGSPSSSTSSYHSSQASPPISPQPVPNPAFLPPPDHTLPAPDVASDIVPPSALTTSHRSLLNLSSPPPPPPEIYTDTPRMGPAAGSRTHSLAGGMAGRKESIHSLRMGRNPPQNQTSALGFVPERTQPQPRGNPQIRDYATTPDISLSPYPGILHPTPIYPNRPPSTSTFSQAPMTVNLPYTLQQIQTSLTALHERLSTLERSQAMLLRREDRKNNWFGWSSRGEADELDDMEDEVMKARWAGQNVNLGTKVRRGSRGKSSLGFKVVWFMIASIRRAMLDVGVGMIIALVGVIILGGGWRRARFTLSRLIDRTKRFIKQS